MLSESLLEKNKRNLALAQLPVRIIDPFYDQEISVTGFMAPGIILSIIFFMAMALTAVSTTREAREGTMERCLVTGVKSFEVISSHVFSQIFVMTLQVTFVLLVVLVGFQIPSQGSLYLVAGLTLLQGLSGMSYGLAISSICTDEQTAIFLALATFIANLLVSGESRWQWIAGDIPVMSSQRTCRYVRSPAPCSHASACFQLGSRALPMA